MDDSDIEEFDRFVEENWGKQSMKSSRIVEDSEGTKKRGRKPKMMELT